MNVKCQNSLSCPDVHSVLSVDHWRGRESSCPWWLHGARVKDRNVVAPSAGWRCRWHSVEDVYGTAR